MTEDALEASQKISSANKKKKAAPFFYEGGGRGKTLTQMMHCMRFSPGIILLTGATGSGRSLVLDSLMQNLQAEEADYCYLAEDCPVLETEEELYQALALGFGLSTQEASVDQLVMDVQRFIAVGIQQKRIMLIAIDDAKQHALDVLDALLQLAGGNKGLSVVLTGEPSFIDVIKQFHLQSLLVHQVSVRSLLPEEVFDFVRQYLALHGVPDADLPRRKELDQLISQTGGNLSLLVQALTEWLLNRKPKKKSLNPSFPWMHIGAMVGVVAIMGMAWLFYPRGISETKRTQSSVQLSKKAFTVEEKKIEEQSVETLVDVHALEKIEPKPMPAQETKTTLSMQSSNQIAVKEVPLISHPKELIQQPVEQIPSPPINPILSVNPQLFTLQVASLSSEKAAKKFIAEQAKSNQSQFSYYARQRNGKATFVVIFGEYTSRKSALEAKNILPISLSKGAPWPRAFKEIQAEIKASL